MKLPDLPEEMSLKDPNWVKDIAPQRIVTSLPGMEQIKVQKDIIYKEDGSSELMADVYWPTNPINEQNNPCIVFIHGGYLPPNLLTKPKEWGVYVSYGQLLAAAGFTGVTFNHRYYGWEYLDMAQGDVTDLIVFMRQQADLFGIDAERISVWAFSGGGPFLSQLIRDTPSYIRAIIVYYAALDMQSSRKDIPQTVSDAQLKAYSPVVHLEENGEAVPPLFVARAGLDRKALNQTVDHFVQTAFAQNITIDVCNHPQGHHGFDVADDNPRTHEIIHRTIDFLKHHG